MNTREMFKRNFINKYLKNYFKYLNVSQLRIKFAFLSYVRNFYF